MEDRDSPVPSGETWGDVFAQALHQQRGRVQEFLAAQRQRLDRAQAELAEQVETIAAELARSESASARTQEEIEHRSGEVQRQSENLAHFKEDLESRQAEWQRTQERLIQQYETLARQIDQRQQDLHVRQEDLQQRQNALEAAEARLHQDQKSFLLERQDHTTELEHVAALRQRLEGQLAEVETQREELAAERIHTQAQRRRIAQEFQQQRAAHVKYLQRRQAELEALQTGQAGDLQRQLESRAQQLEEQAAQVEALRARQVQLIGELETARGEAAELKTRLEAAARCEAQLRGELKTALDGRAELETALAASADREARLRGELKAAIEACEEAERQREAAAERERSGRRTSEGAREQLERELVAAAERETQLRAEVRELEASGGTGTAGGDAEGGEYRRRYELAMDDVREQKKRIQDLEKDLEKARAGHAPASTSTVGGRLDWEAEKRRIMAVLEAESDDDSPEAVRERMEIEKVIQTTQHALAERDREIAELHRVLEEQSTSLGSVAVGAAALGAMLDQDAIIQEERENLRRMQMEWEAKLRQAEIEISVERAKIARERAQLDDRLKELQQRHGSDETESHGADKSQPGDKPARGRWLARLGLKDLDEK